MKQFCLSKFLRILFLVPAVGEIVVLSFIELQVTSLLLLGSMSMFAVITYLFLFRLLSVLPTSHSKNQGN